MHLLNMHAFRHLYSRLRPQSNHLVSDSFDEFEKHFQGFKMSSDTLPSVPESHPTYHDESQILIDLVKKFDPAASPTLFLNKRRFDTVSRGHQSTTYSRYIVIGGIILIILILMYMLSHIF